MSPSDQAPILELRDIPAMVWEAFGDELSLDELVDDLAAVFGEPADAIRPEVDELVTGMVQAGLLDRA